MCTPDGTRILITKVLVRFSITRKRNTRAQTSPAVSMTSKHHAVLEAHSVSVRLGFSIYFFIFLDVIDNIAPSRRAAADRLRIQSHTRTPCTVFVCGRRDINMFLIRQTNVVDVHIIINRIRFAR